MGAPFPYSVIDARDGRVLALARSRGEARAERSKMDGSPPSLIARAEGIYYRIAAWSNPDYPARGYMLCLPCSTARNPERPVYFLPFDPIHYACCVCAGSLAVGLYDE